MSKKKDLFGDDVKSGNDGDFATMFEQSLATAGRKLRVGDGFKGEIISIQKEEAFVSTGTPDDGVILVKDLLNDKKENPFKVGDTIDVVVVKIVDGEIRLARKGSNKSSADMDSLEDAFDMELPVEGRVTEVVKGGYRVSVLGKTAFCPFSQMDSRPIADPNEMIGKKFEFIISQFEPRNIVVSRRKLLDLQKAEHEGAFLLEHEPGAIMKGTVTRLEKFGAFIRLENGVEGLAHISELAWGRVADPSEVVRLGQDVQVKLLKVEEEGTRLKISLSVKQGGGEGDPWLMVSQKFPVGTLVEGTVEKKENYGLFVNFAPGMTGLLPRSKWRDSAEAQSFESKKKGERIKVRIDEIRSDERRVSLGLPVEQEDESWKSHSGTASKAGLGTFADLFNKKK